MQNLAEKDSRLGKARMIETDIRSSHRRSASIHRRYEAAKSDIKDGYALSYRLGLHGRSAEVHTFEELGHQWFLATASHTLCKMLSTPSSWTAWLLKPAGGGATKSCG